MTIRYDRPVSRSAHHARKLGLVALLMLIVALLAHRFGPLTTPDFVTLVLASALPAALAVPLALIGLARLWQVGALGGKAAVKGIFYAALPLGLVAFGVVRFSTLPAIYDVTTDLVEPPRWITPPVANQQWFGHRAEVTPEDREAQLRAYPALTGRRYEGALDRVYLAVRKVAADRGFAIVDERGEQYAAPELPPEPEPEDALEGAPQEVAPEVGPVPQARPLPIEPPTVDDPVGVVRLQVKTRTLVFGFYVDAMIRLREEAETTLVDMRVASRYGPHDLGLGAAIAEQYLHALDAELLGIAGD